MAQTVKKENTRDKILRVSTRMFLENGYTPTTIQFVCSELGISKGNFTFHFHSKDDILAELVGILCKFQWKLMRNEADDGISNLLAICLELMSMAAACEESEVAKDFFVSTYQSPKCLEIIHNNDTARAKEVFAEYCPDWTDEQFREAEILVAGIEHATLNAIDKTVPLETRISGALNAIMTIYNVPEEIRRIKIEKVLAMDYRSIGKRIFNEFKEYVEKENAF
ncbi:MAG: TetR/AcrR family transcriptional regulator [Ruminococcaceae bacterium]|nr:TetR/AcrR family transcriptional regulator [Oscillospiraceae bacterium]